MKITLDGFDGLVPSSTLLGADGRPIDLARGRRDDMDLNLRGESGAGGVQYFDGYLFNEDELNQKLSGREGIAQWNKMRRTDAKVDGAIQTIKLPIKSATWDVALPKEDDPAYERTTEEHVDFARDQLFRRLNWSEYLEHALSAVWAGFSFFEKVYQLDEDGKMVLKKVAPRLASTLWRWIIKDGELAGIDQVVDVLPGYPPAPGYRCDLDHLIFPVGLRRLHNSPLLHCMSCC